MVKLRDEFLNEMIFSDLDRFRVSLASLVAGFQSVKAALPVRLSNTSGLAN